MRHAFPLLILVCAAALRAEDTTPPADAGLIDVRAYGARGDGVADDGPAIRAAMQAVWDRDRAGTVFFANGTYRVSDQIAWRDASGAWRANCSFQGQSEAGVVIRLDDGAAGFGDGANPRAVIYTASNYSANAGGSGNEGYHNHLMDLTIDVGAGNAGATGVDWSAHNIATMRHVTVRAAAGSGAVGIDLRRPYFGPGLLAHVTVHGFAVALWNDDDGSSATMEDIAIDGQREAGIRNGGDVVAIHGLTSVNAVPAVIADYFTGLTVVTDAQLDGGDGGRSGIENSGGSRLFARRIASTGYRSAVAQDGAPVGGAAMGEFTSDAPMALFDAPGVSLDLPIRDFPEYVDADRSDWANACAYGAVPGDDGDDAPAIQAAIDSGKPVVYLPNGVYRLSRPLVLRGALRHLIGYGSQLVPTTDGMSPALRIEATDGDLLVERLTITNAFGVPSVENASPRAVALREIWNCAYRDTVDGTGDLFLDDVAFGPFEFHRQRVWARQLDSEGAPHVTNDGGNLWVLCEKTEIPDAPNLVTQDGGRTELLGGFFSVIRGGPTWPEPSIVVQESSLSATFVSGGAAGDHAVAVRETRGGVTRDLDDPMNRVGVATTMALYVAAGAPDGGGTTGTTSGGGTTTTGGGTSGGTTTGTATAGGASPPGSGHHGCGAGAALVVAAVACGLGGRKARADARRPRRLGRA